MYLTISERWFMSAKVHSIKFVFSFVWYLRERGQILSAHIQPEHDCIVFWPPKNVTLEERLYSQHYISIYPAVCHIPMQGEGTQEDPKLHNKVSGML